MESKLLGFSSIITILVVFYAFYFRTTVDNELRHKLSTVLEALVKVEKLYPVNHKRKVAVGYGGCQDLFVNGRYLLKYDKSAETPQHANEINSKEDLIKLYAYFFRYGAAAERYIKNSSFFDEIVQIASNLDGARFALGGNAPVMASRFVREGCEVVLAAKMSTELQKTLPKGITVIGGDVMSDDIHLILEYKRGETWGIYTSPRANRLIIHNDENNPLVTSLEKFGHYVQDFNPQLFVVSGLQMMDNFPFAKGVRLHRLSKIQEQMLSQSRQTKIHFEMASFSDPELLNEITDLIIPNCDSLGMNEQELANLYSILKYGNISLVSDSNPRVATVLDQMRQVFSLISDYKGDRKLTRLHVHTLAYQAIFTTKNSPWRNTMAAAAKASLTANRHVCGTKEVDIEKAMLIMDDSFSTSISSRSRRVPLDIKRPITCWEDELNPNFDICVAPVLVCTDAHQTAGGGDNISSAGLVLQI